MLYTLTGGDVSKENDIKWSAGMYAAYAYANSKAYANRPKRQPKEQGVSNDV